MQDIHSCFKAYDIRGKSPAQLDAAFAYALGLACWSVFRPARVIIGRDVRLSGPELESAFAGALQDCGCECHSLGLCGTEEIYYAAAFEDYDLGVMITGSHNPADENGFKFVRKGAIPIGLNSGLQIMRDKLSDYQASLPKNPESPCARSVRRQYVDWLLEYAGFTPQGAYPQHRSMKVVIDAGNGCAGPMVRALAPGLPVEIIPLNFEPDSSFPHGVPNPLLPARRQELSKAVVSHRADLGIGFDGDFDRCFFFDENGRMVESCYLVGLMAAELLAARPGQKIVHDARVYWNTQEAVRAAGGIPIMSRGGHTCMKETMRAEKALYGGEMSAHHFYRDFAWCDSGMLTMLLMLALLGRDSRTLAERTDAAIKAWPCSGEINFKVGNSSAIIEKILGHYAPQAAHMDRIDGINLEFADWRFNLRSSNTEPLLRLNVESRGDRDLVDERVAQLRELIGGDPA